MYQAPDGTYFGICDGNDADEAVERLVKRIEDAESNASMRKGWVFVFVSDSSAASQWVVLNSPN